MYTAIVTAREDEPYLAEAIKSILSQTVAPLEVIVSIDPDAKPACNTEKVAKLCGDKVAVIRAESPGMISALNTAIGLVKTPFVAFLDSDDLWLPAKQERQIEILRSHPHLHASTSLAANFRVDSRGNKMVEKETQSIVFTGTTFRTDVFESFGLIDPLATHHTWLYRWWSDALRLGIRLETTGSVGVLRRLHDRNSWVVDNDRAHLELVKELRRILSEKRNREST